MHVLYSMAQSDAVGEKYKSEIFDLTNFYMVRALPAWLRWLAALPGCRPLRLMSTWPVCLDVCLCGHLSGWMVTPYHTTDYRRRRMLWRTRMRAGRPPTLVRTKTD